MTKIKYKGKCKNLNELYVLYSQALKQVINIKDNGDNVEKLNELTANRQRVFLVYTANLADSSDFVFDWFLRNPWVVADKIDYEGFFSPTIFLYEKIN